MEWTTDPESGRSNNSAEFKRLVSVVQCIISSSAFDLLGGRHEVVAGVIMARLAHAEGVGPLPIPKGE